MAVVRNVNGFRAAGPIDTTFASRHGSAVASIYSDTIESFTMSDDVMMATRRAISALQRRNLRNWQVVDHVSRVAVRPVDAAAVEQTARKIVDEIDKQAPEFSEKLKCDCVGYPDALVRRFTEEVATVTRSAIEAATFVYAHAILDNVASELCRLLMQTEPREWESQLLEKKIAYGDLGKKSHDEIRDALLGRVASELNRDTLVKRIRELHRCCRPSATKILYNDTFYTFDENRIGAIDTARQDILHRLAFTKQTTNLREETTYLRATVDYLFAIVQERLDLRTTPAEHVYGDQSPKSPGTFTMLAQDLLAGSIQFEQVVIRRGALYVRDHDGQLYPLAHDVEMRGSVAASSDKTRVAYVTQRLDPNAAEPSELEYDTGIRYELWTADSNGTNAKLLVSSGNIPQAVRSAPEVFNGGGAGCIIERIWSPTWSHDDKWIYFQVPMWMTSAAVFRVHLDDGAVEFFTDGNWFMLDEANRGCLIVRKHKYWPVPEDYNFDGEDPRPFGSYDHLWMVNENGTEVRDLDA